MRLSISVDFKVKGVDLLDQNYPIPNFLIQPLIENALWHGLDDKEGSVIELYFRPDMVTKILTIIVADNGKGLNEGKTRERRSFGLNILREMLMLISNKSSLSIENREGATGCLAKIYIPLIPSLD